MHDTLSIGPFLRENRRIALFTFDALAWAFAMAVAAIARRDMHVSEVEWGHTALLWVIIVVLHSLFAWASRLHEGRAAVATVDEFVWLGTVTAMTGLVVFVGNLSLTYVPRSVPVVATFVAVAVMVWGRATYRRSREAAHWRRRAFGAEHPVVVVGAGEGGRQLVRSLISSRDSQWDPVGFVDDDPAKRHLRVLGVPVRGRVEDLAEVAADASAGTVIVAVPSAGADLYRKVSDIAVAHGLELKVLPGVGDLLDGRVQIRDIRDLDLTDILGRTQVDTDISAIADYLKGRRVLVTGAGGSIGSELCRQIRQFGPSELIMLDRDESALHQVQLSIHGRALLDTPDTVLCDIRDLTALQRIFDARRPDVVFHAAALKHLPLLEQYPYEGFQTNVLGTNNVLQAAHLAGVTRFVNISTDKAANPTSVLGYTKRLAEGLTAHMAQRSTGSYISVRFGNVLGSRGSVLETFAAQIASGGPLTVTHPEITRYFMTIPEAVQLVIQAGAIGADGEALVLDMGDPVKIDYVARQLIALSGRRIKIEYSGLRDGEKLHEDLIAENEQGSRTRHPLISHVAVNALPPASLESLSGTPDAGMKARLELACDRMAEGQLSGSRNVVQPTRPSRPS